jgi:hypothetical protein
MKNVLAGLLLLGVGVAVGRFEGGASPAEAVGAQGGGVASCAAKNGDVNGDGNVDMSDPVTILGNLFLGSPAVLVPLCSAQGGGGLPDTGQTQCFSCEGVSRCDVILPVGSPLFGQDSRVRTGCPNDANRFTDHGDGTVTDNCTGLMWQKESSDVNDDGNIDTSDSLNWCDALAHCAHLTFAGHDDWRLPNVRELQSIVDYGKDASIEDVFRLPPASLEILIAYLTSTSNVLQPSEAWAVAFRGSSPQGVVTTTSKGALHFLRAVRGGS